MLMRLVDNAAVGLLRAHGARSEWIDGDGTPVHVLRKRGRGEAPPVLLLHGLGSCASDYIGVIAGLAACCHEVVAIDLPGHGLTPPPPEGMTPEGIRRVATAALDALMVESMVVFGNSLGGLTAIRLALHRPGMVRGLLLASPAGAPMSEEDFARLMVGFQYRDHRSALEFVARFTPRPGLFRHPFAWGVRQRMGRESVRDFLGRIGPVDLLGEEDLGGLRMPIEVVWGAHDQVLPAAHADFFRTRLPAHARVEVIEGLGHVPYVDDLSGFTGRISRFAMACR